MTYLSKDQLDKYLNNLPAKNKSISPSSATATSIINSAVTSPGKETDSKEQYDSVRKDLIYPMKKMSINDGSTADSRYRGSGADAFETSLRSPSQRSPSNTFGATKSLYSPPAPPLATTRKTNTTNITTTNRTPATAKKPAHLSKPNSSPTYSQASLPNKKVSVPNPLYSQTLCGNCNKPVSTGVMVSALSKKWHTGCFTCHTCGIPLDKVEFFEKDGHAYCASDYRNLFSSRCDYCKEPIDQTSIQALGKQYHVGHFFCHSCKVPFDEMSAFMIHDGQPYCENDYLVAFGHQCQGCRQYIKGSFIGALGGDWHKDCFVCADCGKPFPTGSFHVRDNRPYCEEHARVLSSLPSPSSTSNDAGSKKVSNVNYLECCSCLRPLSVRVPGLWQKDDSGNVICKQCVRNRA